MEQHNIDSRFKQGLENLNRQPSADAWARLQSRMQEPLTSEAPILDAPEEKKEEKRILLWWHYAAAAVVLLFVTFGIVKNGSFLGEKTEMPLAVNQTENISKKAEPTIKTPEVPATVTDKIAETENLIAVAEITSSDEPENKNGSQNAVKTALKTNFSKRSKQQIAQVTKVSNADNKVKPATEQKTVTAKQPETTSDDVLLASNQITTQKQTTETIQSATQDQPLFAGMVIEVIVKKDPTENALAKAETGTDADKDSRLKNIFKQAKNIKNGEQIDFQDLGLSADSKLAVSTRNITQKFSKILDNN